MNHLLAIGLIFLMLSGCARSPERNYYTLRSPAPTATTPKAVFPSRTLAIESVSVPESVDRPKIVTRSVVDGRMEVSDQARWSDPLASEIASVLADALQISLSSTQVTTPSQLSTSLKPDIRVVVDITRFEGVLGKGVDVDAVWAVKTSGGQNPVQARVSIHEETSAGDYGALATAFSKALRRVSIAILNSLPI